MFTRIALMFVVITTLCGAAFSLGSKSSAGRQDPSGIPAEHPVSLALRHQQELNLTEEQTQKLVAMRDALAKEFAPLHEQANALQQRMEELQKSGNPDEAAGAKLKQDADALGTKVQPIFEKYAQEVGKLLSDEQRQKLMKFSEAEGHPKEDQDFVLNVIMQSREQLDITPQQFTKLQYLQADFIRAFAPIREKMELMQIEMKDKVAKEGSVDPTEYKRRGEDIQEQVAALQSKISDQAIAEVLDPTQRKKLEELQHGEHRSAPNGG